MLINLKDFLIANIEYKAELEQDFSSEVLQNAEQYCLLQYIEQNNGALIGVVFKKDADIENTIKTNGAKIVELQDKLRAFNITDEERELLGGLFELLEGIINYNSVYSVELGGVSKNPFESVKLIVM